MSENPSPVSFPTVLTAELDAIRTRRQRNPLTSNPAGEDPPSEEAASQPSPSDIGRVPTLEEVRCAALQENLVGLAFSGGGIRSATFNLGILQGLADLKLLRYFDYLSTVSGGGYVGSWLAAWIKREGSTENVERQLQSSRLHQAEAERQGLKKGEVFDAEPEPIHHLRSYSNYLTPQLGFLSVDSWVLAAIYLRNMLLNLLVLVPLLLGLVMAERLLAMVFIMTTDTTSTEPWEFAVWLLGQLTVLVMLLLVFLWIHRSITQIQDSHQGSGIAYNFRLERRYLHRYIMIPLLTLGVLFTWLSHLQFQWLFEPGLPANFTLLSFLGPTIPIDRIWLARLVAGSTMALMVGTFHLLATFVPGDNALGSGPVEVLARRLARWRSDC